MRYDPAALYRIETNAGYAWRPAQAPPVLTEFGLADGAAEELVKPSATSRLFRSGGVIARSADAATAERLERQAEIAHAVDGLVRPLRARAGGFVVRTGGRAWIAYRELEGELFDGRSCSVETAVAAALALIVALKELAVDTTPLERVRHRPERWPGTLARLAETHELVADNLDELLELANRLAALELEPGLVHDDLNHANVLVARGRPVFLDLEDIRLEDLRVAGAHAAFKLARHAVHTGAASVAEARAQAVGPIDPDTLLAYGAYRILSELDRILDDPASHYDLDKKVANLFELYDLVRDGPRPRR